MIAATLAQGLAYREVMIWQYLESNEPAALIFFDSLLISTSRRLLLFLPASISANALLLVDRFVKLGLSEMFYAERVSNRLLLYIESRISQFNIDYYQCE